MTNGVERNKVRIVAEYICRAIAAILLAAVLHTIASIAFSAAYNVASFGSPMNQSLTDYATEIPVIVAGLMVLSGLLFEVPKSLWLVRQPWRPFWVSGSISILLLAFSMVAVLSVGPHGVDVKELFTGEQLRDVAFLSTLSGFSSALPWWRLVVIPARKRWAKSRDSEIFA